MRGFKRYGGKVVGLAAIFTGSVILFALFLPAGFWWGAVAVVLIGGGAVFIVKR